MKKPQCEKPTSYNCGEACINVSKACQRNSFDAYGKMRLQKLKSLALIYAQGKSQKNQKQKAAADKLIGAIESKRKREATELAVARTEINKERRKARLKAEARVKREQLLKMFDEVAGSKKKGKGIDYFLDKENPIPSLRKEKIEFEQKIKQARTSNIEQAEELTKTTLKKFRAINRKVESFLEEARKLVEVDSPTDINVTMFGTNEENNRLRREGVAAFSRMVSIPDLKEPIAITDAPAEWGTRSFYAEGSNAVFMGNNNPKTIVHEMSHWLEEKVPGIRQEIVEFYNKRTQGEKTVKLKDVTGNPYGDDEVTKVDKWLHPYMGKEYENASEILSMGLEMMYKNPVYLAKNDPEMFDFIYGVVRRK